MISSRRRHRLSRHPPAGRSPATSAKATHAWVANWRRRPIGSTLPSLSPYPHCVGQLFDLFRYAGRYPPWPASRTFRRAHRNGRFLTRKHPLPGKRSLPGTSTSQHALAPRRRVTARQRRPTRGLSLHHRPESVLPKKSSAGTQRLPSCALEGVEVSICSVLRALWLNYPDERQELLLRQ